MRGLQMKSSIMVVYASVEESFYKDESLAVYG